MYMLRGLGTRELGSLQNGLYDLHCNNHQSSNRIREKETRKKINIYLFNNLFKNLESVNNKAAFCSVIPKGAFNN